MNKTKIEFMKLKTCRYSSVFRSFNWYMKFVNFIDPDKEKKR